MPMDAAMATRPTAHVVLFPFPGHGHLPGMLAVARLIRRSFPQVTIMLVSTARNIAAIRGESAASISLHALPFVPADHGLPDACESISSLPVAQFITLFEAFESLEPAFDALVSKLRRDDDAGGGVCVVADPIVAWTVNVARRHGCAHALLLGCSALGSAIMHALWKIMPALPFGPDGVLRLRVPEHHPEQEEAVLHRSQLSTIFLDAERAERWTAFQRRRIQYGYRTDAVLVNTVEEFEPRGLAMVRHTLGDDVSVYPVGPLVRGEGDGHSGHEHDVIGWLNTQRPASVLYICFGSQNSIRPKQMTELAGALELTGRPFVWAIRAPVGLKDDSGGDMSSWLPDGFEERAREQNRGRLVRGWAPQVSILAHAATGGFLSHCGRNSVLESLTQGVPIVGWPVSAEQFYNAKMLQEEWGVCVEAARGNLESSEVCRSELAEVSETVMGDTDTAGRMRRRVLEVQEMLSKAWADDGGSSRTALHGFFAAMRLVIT